MLNEMLGFFNKKKKCFDLYWMCIFIILLYFSAVINAENVVHKSEKFIAMATRTKCEYLKDLAENSVTTTTVDSGVKSSKFSLSHKKREKTCPHPAPDFLCKGALVWRVEVRLFIKSKQTLDIWLVINWANFIALLSRELC